MSKIAMVVKLDILEGKRDEALATLGKLVAAAEAEPGTLQYLLHTEVQSPDTVWFYELYQDQAAFEAHSGSATMAEVIGSLGGLLGGPPDMRQLDIVSAAGGA